MDACPLNILTYGWEFYPQKRLDPGTFDGHHPQYLFLGQYGGFEGKGSTGSPRESATYRLNILLPFKLDEYALELPEIYSASRVWINGSLISHLGNISGSGQPAIRTRMVTFQATSQAEIVVQAVDHIHYYSGMIYPPASGTMETISDLISLRLMYACIMVISSFTIGIIHLMIGIGTGEERRQMILFALISLLFALYATYPLLHLFDAGYWSYRLENTSFFLFLLAVATLHCSLCRISGSPQRIILSLDGFITLLTLIISSFLINDSLSTMMAYSIFLDSCKLLLFSQLIVTICFNKQCDERINGLLLAGLCIIAVSLLLQTTLPALEPIQFGWQAENAGFAFILILGGGLWFDTVRTYADRAALTENVRLIKKQFSPQEENYWLTIGNFAKIRRIRHDLRHRLSTIKELVGQHQYEEPKHYIMGREDSSEQITRPALCESQAANAVLNYYQQAADEKNISLHLKVALPSELKLEGWNLGILLGNLLENAIEASEKLSEEMRLVKVYSRVANGNLLLTVKNHWSGEFLVSREQVYSTKHQGVGIGLPSVHSLVKKKGDQFFISPNEPDLIVSVVLWNAADQSRFIRE